MLDQINLRWISDIINFDRNWMIYNRMENWKSTNIALREGDAVGNFFFRPLQDGGHLPWQTGNYQNNICLVSLHNTPVSLASTPVNLN